MDAYVYNADIYCEDCARDIKRRIRAQNGGIIPPAGDRDDSECWPQYVADGSGESDCPQHCGSGPDCLNAMELDDGSKIGLFLENQLTDDGREYVQSAHRDDPSEVTRFWMDFYGLDTLDDESDDD